MKKAIAILCLSFLLCMSAVPFLALAQGGAVVPVPGGGGPVIDDNGGVVPLPNPLGSNTGDDADPRVLIGRIISYVLGIVGSIALAIFIYGGITWMTSAGNRDKVEKGKQMITWAVLGLGLIFFSYALVTFIISALVKS